MTTWLPRGLAFAFAMVVLRLVQGTMINAWETQAGLISIFLVAIYTIAAVVLGYIDGTADAKAQPDPDRRADLSMQWLLAGMVAGVVSGALAWFISLFYSGLYVGGLNGELTVFAAFTALLTFVAAQAGVTIGRTLVDRRAPDVQRRRGDDDTADTDVFAAVGGSPGADQAARGAAADQPEPGSEGDRS